jgi:hypothetical protein
MEVIAPCPLKLKAATFAEMDLRGKLCRIGGVERSGGPSPWREA